MRNLIASGWRFRIVAGALALCFLIVVGRLWWLQIYTAEHYRRAADENRSVTISYPASRGKIIDSHGNVLALNKEIFSLRCDREIVTDEDREKLPEIAKVLGMPLAELKEKVDPAPPADGVPARLNRNALIKADVDKATADAVTALLPRVVSDAHGKKVTRSFFPIFVERSFVRTYPLGSCAAHILGFVNRENKATSGIELALNRFLKGEDGWRESKLDGRRREQPRLRERDVPARDGCTVQLTLDARIQGIAETASEKIAREFKPVFSSIIVSDAKSGRILALANNPTFDLNKFNSSPIENQRNRAVTDVYEPGSVFKIVTVAAALEEGVVTENSVFDCAITQAPYRGKMRKLPREDHKMEKLSVHDIIKLSSNRGSAQIAMRFCEKYGEEAYVAYIRRFGFGEKTGLVGASGEQTGIVPAPKRWDGLTITRLPMGHAIAVTPLQIHGAMSVIASGGMLMEPQIVQAVIDEEQKSTLPFPPTARRRVVSEKTAKLVAEMLRSVCVEGTGKNADIPGYNVAGKTGTSQRIVNGKYSDDTYVTSFSGFFPAENPRIVITVVIDNPIYFAERWVAVRDENGKPVRRANGDLEMEKKVVRTRPYGSSVAAPIFKEVAEGTIRWLEIRPSAVVSEKQR